MVQDRSSDATKCWNMNDCGYLPPQWLCALVGDNHDRNRGNYERRAIAGKESQPGELTDFVVLQLVGSSFGYSWV
jgi:hypothetical protein